MGWVYFLCVCSLFLFRVCNARDIAAATGSFYVSLKGFRFQIDFKGTVYGELRIYGFFYPLPPDFCKP